jgi:hypothetical protein
MILEDEMTGDTQHRGSAQNTDDKDGEQSGRHNEDVDVYELNRSRRKGSDGDGE